MQLKPYGAGKGETLNVMIDERTKISSTEADLNVGALRSGAAVDVRYDPDSGRAAYIFVY